MLSLEFQEQQQASIVPLVQSIKDLAECQRQLAFDHAEEQQQEQQVDLLQQEVNKQECQRERCFRRRAELSDLARKCRKLNAELDPSDQNSKRLSDFYVAETNEILEELQQFDNNSSTTIA